VISKDYAVALNRKKKVFAEKTRTKKQLFMAIITAHGLKNSPIILHEEGSVDLINGVVVLDDLFSEKSAAFD